MQRVLDAARKGDLVVVWKLDRLGRSLRHLIDTITLLEERGVGFRSLTENIDTTSTGGRLVFHIFGALAQFERDLIRDRTKAGLAAARARGRKGGRKPKLSAEQIEKARRRAQQGRHAPAHDGLDRSRPQGLANDTVARSPESAGQARTPKVDCVGVAP